MTPVDVLVKARAVQLIAKMSAWLEDHPFEDDDE